MNKLVRRLATELRTRGPAGFLRFVGLRLAQWRGDVLFELDLQQISTTQQVAQHGPLVQVDRHTLGSGAAQAVEQAVLTEVNHAYREDLRGEGQLFALTDAQGQVTSYGFVLFDSFYKRILGEARSTPMISNCYTLPAQRGQGLYPCLIQSACRQLAAQGYQRAIITCAPDNAASIRGIEKAGFRRVKTLYSLVLVTRWIALQKRVSSPDSHA